MEKVLILLSWCFCFLSSGIASQEQSSVEELNGKGVMKLIQQKSNFDYESLSQLLIGSISSLQKERRQKSGFSEGFAKNIDKAFAIFDRFKSLWGASDVEALRQLWEDVCLITNDGFYDVSNICISVLEIEQEEKDDLVRYLASLNRDLWQTRELVSWKLAQISGASDVIVDLGVHLLSSCLFRKQFSKNIKLIKDVLIAWGCKNAPCEVKQMYAINFDDSDATDEDGWISKTGESFLGLLDDLRQASCGVN